MMGAKFAGSSPVMIATFGCVFSLHGKAVGGGGQKRRAVSVDIRQRFAVQSAVRRALDAGARPQFTIEVKSASGGMATMWNIRRTVLAGLAVLVIGALWPARTMAQEKPGVVTVFDHEKLDASFDKALDNGGTNLLWNHTSNGTIYKVDTPSRESVKSACKPEGCSHTRYTPVVYGVRG